jgi:hypothetical protein
LRPRLFGITQILEALPSGVKDGKILRAGDLLLVACCLEGVPD